VGELIIVDGLDFANISNKTLCGISTNDNGSIWVGEKMGIKTIIDIDGYTQRS
jgi:hypothetical protein